MPSFGAKFISKKNLKRADFRKIILSELEIGLHLGSDPSDVCPNILYLDRFFEDNKYFYLLF